MSGALEELVILVACSSMLGVIIGVLGARVVLQPKIQEAYKRGRKEREEEYEAEKARFAVELGEHLGKVRDTIVQSVSAYESVVDVARRHLTPALGDTLALKGPDGSRLQIGFKSSTPQADTQQTKLPFSDGLKAHARDHNLNPTQTASSSKLIPEKVVQTYEDDLKFLDRGNDSVEDLEPGSTDPRYDSH